MRRPFSTSFQVISGELNAAEADRQTGPSTSLWVVVAFANLTDQRPRFYVLSRQEFWEFLHYLPAQWRTRPIWLSLTRSRQIDEAGVLQAGEAFRDADSAHTIDDRYHERLVRLGADGQPVAVLGWTPDLPSWPDPIGPTYTQRRSSDTRSPPSPAPVGDADEGTAPVRHPAITAKNALAPGDTVTISINLLREPDVATLGAPLALAGQPDTWTALPIGVTLVCAGIDFADGGRGTVLVQRNQDSIAALVQGTVNASLKNGDIVDVHAQFWDGTRCTGSAVRTFTVGPDNRHLPTSGMVRVALSAAKPDLTVFISLFDPSTPGKMRWILATESFDGLPARLAGNIDLGQSPRDEANDLFRQLANLPRGEHLAAIEAVGERLWEKAPLEFREAYWALVKHYGRPLTIQFTSDDPHLPWELMKPTSEAEVHPFLAERHAVARWIGAYQGYLSNKLPAGDIVVVAPHYQSVSVARPKTEEAAEVLRRDYGAVSVPGTRDAFIDLLENPPDQPVALLYFTGHGKFDAKTPSSSAIKLENGKQLLATEVRRAVVKLGEKYGTAVFFNACEVGATAAAFGEVGGWADAFLARRFRAFIAPLWAVDEEDAAIVSAELMAKLVQDKMPIGTALQEIRAQHGKTSPTFYAYLVYGDVTACFDADMATPIPTLVGATP